MNENNQIYNQKFKNKKDPMINYLTSPSEDNRNKVQLNDVKK